MEIVSKRSDYITLVDEVSPVSVKLTVSENEIYSLSVPSEWNLKVKDADLLTLAETISNTVNIRLGLKTREEADEVIFLNTIERDCSKFPGLTSGEILKALEMGLDGVFNPDKDIFFNSSVFVRWIRTYIEETKKPVIAKHAQLVHQIKEPSAEPTLRESLESKFKILEMAIDKTLSGAIYQDYGNVLYDFLEKFGYLVLTTDQKWKAMDMAKLMMLSEAQDSKDRAKIKSVMNMITDYGNGIKNEAIAVTAKRWIISGKLKEITLAGLDDAADFLENVKIKVADYLEEHEANH